MSIYKYTLGLIVLRVSSSRMSKSGISGMTSRFGSTRILDTVSEIIESTIFRIPGMSNVFAKLVRLNSICFEILIVYYLINIIK